MTRRALLTILLVLLAGLAAAQGGGAPTGLNRYLDAAAWLDSLQSNAGGYTDGVMFWARALAALGAVLSILLTMLRGSPAGYLDLFTRLMVVMFVFGTTAQLGDWNLQFWNLLREWSMGHVERTFERSAPELEAMGRNAGALLAVLGAPAVVSAAGTAAAGSRVAVTAAAREGAAEIGSLLAHFLNAAIIPVLAFVVVAYLIILLSGLLIAFANILLPIAAAMLMFGTSTGEKWLSAYFSAILTGFFIVALMPLAFNAAFEFTVVQPIRTVNENFRDADDVWAAFESGDLPDELQELQTEIATLEARQAAEVERATASGTWRLPAVFHETARGISELRTHFVDGITRFYEERQRELLAVAESTMLSVRNWLLRLALFFIGTLFGLYFIITSSNAVAGLIGGVGMGAASALARPLSVVGGNSLFRATTGGSSQPSHRPAITGGSSTAALGPGTSPALSNAPTEGSSPGGGRSSVGPTPNRASKADDGPSKPSDEEGWA